MPVSDYDRQEEDRRLQKQLMDESDPKRWARLLHEYYYDSDRADRTSRQLMMLHLGMATGMLLRRL